MKINNTKAVSSITNTTLDANANKQQVATGLVSKTLSKSQLSMISGGSGSGGGIWPPEKTEKTEKTEKKVESRSGSGGGVWPEKAINP